jgi:dTDP-4-amino-4,6-dideoxygalactose transaminase
MIPLVDLKAQYQFLKPEIAAAIELVLDSGQFVLGDQVAAFEQEFAQYVGAAEGIGVNTGTSALHLALLAAGVGLGDEVITVPFTFVATVAAIGYTGARAVFVDIDPLSYTMDVTELERAVTPRTKAIVPVHLYGHSADMDPILEVARRHGLVVIEDACQAHGAEYKDRRVGSIGLMGCFSFYPGKNLGACGEGGMVVTSDPQCARTVRMLRDWGQDRKYHHVLKGFNYRMEGLQGSILRVKLRHLDGWTEARRTHARGYDSLLADAGLVTPAERPWARHVYHIYAVRTRARDALQRTLHANGVQSGIHYPVPVHLQPAYADLGYRAGQFPQAERAAAEVLSLPMYPELSRTQREMVGAVMRNEAYVI